MFGTTIARKSIASIRNEKRNLQCNKSINLSIKQLQREMVNLSFQEGKTEEISLIVGEIKRLRAALKMGG